jgi:hypothetical protein
VATVWVEFDGLRVAVLSALPEVVLDAERAFRAMIVSGDDRAAPVIARLEIDRCGDDYQVSGSGLSAPERGQLSEARRAVRYHTTRAFLEARPEWFWVHAAAASRDGRAVLVPGERARGKSTLVTALARAGWRYLSDDAVPLDMADHRAAPFPLTPHVRSGPGGIMAPESIFALPKRDVELEPDMICREAVPITELVFVRFEPGASAFLTPARPGEAALGLLESCLNYPYLGARAVRYAAELVQRAPAVRLTFGDVTAAVRLLDATPAR